MRGEHRGLGEFLIELGENPGQLRRYRKDRRAALADSGLSPEHQQLLLSGDVKRIQAELQREYPDAKVFLLPGWDDVMSA
ncbi:MAG: hypothetical protein ICV64_01970 [Thermoleophilia bacterium]|nr:hypothetical protein [Thermoleophilia bacterium]